MSTHAQQFDRTDSETAISSTAAPLAVQTTFRHMSTSAAVAEHVMKEARKLQRFFDRITHCHVVIVAPHKHHRHGRQYSIHVELGVPHGPLLVNHEPAAYARVTGSRREQKRPEPNVTHDDIYVTLRDTFDVARRRLEDHARRLRRAPARAALDTILPGGGRNS
jgi:ribosome-associated translation inhibitor RaiA